MITAHKRMSSAFDLGYMDLMSDSLLLHLEKSSRIRESVRRQRGCMIGLSKKRNGKIITRRQASSCQRGNDIRSLEPISCQGCGVCQIANRCSSASSVVTGFMCGRSNHRDFCQLQSTSPSAEIIARSHCQKIFGRETRRPPPWVHLYIGAPCLHRIRLHRLILRELLSP